jgi:hypothetical protein
MLKKVDFLLEKQYQLERERQTARRRVLQELARELQHQPASISASIAATLERDNGIDPIMGQQNNVDITR